MINDLINVINDFLGRSGRAFALSAGGTVIIESLGIMQLVACAGSVSYTHLTLPTSLRV